MEESASLSVFLHAYALAAHVGIEFLAVLALVYSSEGRDGCPLAVCASQIREAVVRQHKRAAGVQKLAVLHEGAALATAGAHGSVHWSAG